MNVQIKFQDLGMVPYKEAWDYQEQLLEKMQQPKPNPTSDDNLQNFGGYLLLCEHPHVYTLGRNGEKSNLLIPEDRLKAEHISFFHIDRGGDITYHGPGQLVGYPILDLNLLNIGVKKYIFLIEETIILTLAEIGLQAGRLDNTTGVWIHPEKNKTPQKICAIGVKVSHGITMHGFAFNINTDLKFFQYINPCGFTDKGVTSVKKETGRSWDFEEMKQQIKKNLREVFHVHLTG